MREIVPQHPPHVLVTGANGFVGSEVCRHLLRRGFPLTAAVRRSTGFSGGAPDSFRQVVWGNPGQETDWAAALQGVQTIIHLAARVHIMAESSRDAAAAFRRANVAATETLARAAVAYGVKRFIFLSSIKVNGEQTAGTPFQEQDIPNPQDSYALSKWEAEQALNKIAGETGLDVVILRPPLVFGPRVKANFLRLLRWVDQGVPLPLALVQNRRSLIYLGNLADAITTCVAHPAVAGNTYVLSDGADVSTPELIRQMANAFGKPPRLWPLPEVIVRLLGMLAGKKSEVDRLLGSLQINASRFRRDTGWRPPYTLPQGIKATVAWYQGEFGR